MITPRADTLAANLKTLYYSERAKPLLFHGWHHIYLTAVKSVEFAAEFPEVDKEIIQAAALVHDLNYIVKTNSEPEIGEQLRKTYLDEASFSEGEIAIIERLVLEAHTATRSAAISDAAKALSDADSLFKVLPLTPILFSSHYLTENKVGLEEWADKIIREQKPLMDEDIYFYTKVANDSYLRWAKTNLALVEQVKEALSDPAIKEILDIAQELEAVRTKHS